MQMGRMKRVHVTGTWACMGSAKGHTREANGRMKRGAHVTVRGRTWAVRGHVGRAWGHTRDANGGNETVTSPVRGRSWVSARDSAEVSGFERG